MPAISEGYGWERRERSGVFRRATRPSDAKAHHPRSKMINRRAVARPSDGSARPRSRNANQTSPRDRVTNTARMPTAPAMMTGRNASPPYAIPHDHTKGLGGLLRL